MGWNAGYTIFESTVVGAYDLDKLDKGLLTVLMEPYRGSDIDSGGNVIIFTDGSILNLADTKLFRWQVFVDGTD